MLRQALVMFLCLALAGPLWAKQAPPDTPPLAVLRAALDLTDEQVSDIRALLEERSESVRAANADIDALEAEMRELLRGDAPDPAEVGAIVLETSELRQEIRGAQDSFQTAFDGLMSPEQLQRLDHLHRLAHAARAIDALKELRIH